MELRQYLHLLWSKSWLIGFFAVVGLVVALIISRNSTPIYQSSTKLMLNQTPANGGVDYNSLLANERLATTYVQILNSRPILRNVINNLQLNMDVDTLAKQVKPNVVRDTEIISITVEDVSAERAAKIANAVVKEFRAYNQNSQASSYALAKQPLQAELDSLHAEISRIQNFIDGLGDDATNPANASERNRLSNLLIQSRNDYTNLLKALTDLQLGEAQANNRLVTIEEALPETTPVRPRLSLNLLIGIILGLVLGVGTVFLLNYLNDSVRLVDEAKQLLGVSALGQITPIEGKTATDKIVALNQPQSLVAEDYRVLQANLEFVRFEKSVQSILITSSQPGEGKSTTLANLAVTLAKMDKRVILVDADLRKPVLHQFFGALNKRGLTTLLLEQGGELKDYLIATDIENLRLLPSGALPPNPAELLSSTRFGNLIERLKTEADLILVDSPPLLSMADTLVLANQCDATVLVVWSGNTKRHFLKQSREQLTQSGSYLLGFVFNRAKSKSSRYYSDYNHKQPKRFLGVPLPFSV